MKKAVINRETEKLELHFDKADYQSLPAEDKAAIKSCFLWSRTASAWVSRAKWPHTYAAEKLAERLGFDKPEKEGDRLTFAEKVEREADRAEARADRMDARADRAEKTAEALQKPMNDHHGDIAFFTQPNINTSAGRAFTHYRNRVYEQFDRGIEEYRKSEYYRQRAETARETAAGEKYSDTGYLARRIKETEKTVRDIRKLIDDYSELLTRLENGETLTRFDGTPVTLEWIDERGVDACERLEAAEDKLAWLKNRLEEIGGVRFSPENVKPGYIVKVAHHGTFEVLKTARLNFTGKCTTTGMPLVFAFAEITEIIKAEEKAPETHPFTVGDAFTVRVYANGYAKPPVKVVWTVTRITDKSVFLENENGDKITRRPFKVTWRENEWGMTIQDTSDGTVYKSSTTT